MITKETIKALKENLQTEYAQHLSNANAAKGAIQVCDHLLSLPDVEVVKSCPECPAEE